MALKNVGKILELKYDRLIFTALGKNRNSTNWINKKWMWSEFVTQLQFTQRTNETYAEYAGMTRAEQDNIKDCGGFVGGDCAKGKRKKENINSRCLITLDADDIHESTEDFYNRVLMLGAAHVVYSTHKHHPKSPRLRVIFLLNRNVTPDEYQAVARKVAEMIDIEAMDKTTYQINRLMYWPSTPKDIEPFFRSEDMPMLDADEILEGYPDWRDMSYWPRSSKETQTETNSTGKKPEDPREKRGVIGAFCNVYSPISVAIDKFLNNVYTPGTVEGRYTFIAGTTANGLITDDLTAYSNHGTDPANNGHSHNAFDLVRIHKFGKGDEKESFKLMEEFAANDPETALYMQKKKHEETGEEFTDDNPEWRSELKNDKKGKSLATFRNVLLIFKNDPELRDFYHDAFAHKTRITGNIVKLPFEQERDWKDEDMSAVRGYLETYYGIKGREVISDVFNVMTVQRAVHPIRNYIDSLIWDRTQRLDTVFIDHFGAVDSEYTRMATRLFFTAAIKRIYEPGCQFDYMVVLISEEQGLRKTTFFRKLGKDKWYASLGSDLGRGKDASEIIQGKWIIECEELTSITNSKSDSARRFITSTTDRFRPSYGHFAADYPRQCVFVGTTNTIECLQDQTGGRRFFPIEIIKRADLEKINIDQLWAEAKYLYEHGQKLYMEPELEDVAKQIQREHTTETPMAGAIREFLDIPLPENWEGMNHSERWAYYNGDDDLEAKPKGTQQRTKVCALEIWELVYGGRRKEIDDRKAKEINDVLRNTPGWKRPNSKSKQLNFPGYGQQRAFVRT
jgi:putative DNA primase/helicase